MEDTSPLSPDIDRHNSFGALNKMQLHRQRSSSESLADDMSIQATNDDAAMCKLYGINLKYWSDPYLHYFIRLPDDKKAPEISRGYFARVKGVRMLIEQFLKKAGTAAQIVSLGAGFDTLYWLLKDAGCNIRKFVEVDFPLVTSKKIHNIMRMDALRKGIAQNDDQIKVIEHMDLHSDCYNLLSADLRSAKELDAKLKSCEIDFTAPTLFLSECVLIYMTAEQSERLITYLASAFKTACYVNYEQVNIDDQFGHVMQDNLHFRGICMAGITPCKDVESQKRRFLDAGWAGAKGWDMNAVYKSIPSSELKRIEKLEFLDEVELLTQLLHHYCIVYTYKDLGKIGLDVIGFN